MKTPTPLSVSWFKLILAGLLSCSLLLAQTPVPNIQAILADYISKGETTAPYLRKMLDAPVIRQIGTELQVNLGKIASQQEITEALETAARMAKAGVANRVTTTEQLADVFKRPNPHGEVFETLSARAQNAQTPGRTFYARTNNPGIDYGYSTRDVLSSTGKKWVGVQAKATKVADTSLREAALDSLQFYGHDHTARMAAMQKGSTGFEAVIPKDQFERLVKKGILTNEGRLTEKPIQDTLRAAYKLTKKAGEAAEITVAGRIRTALPRGPEILRSVVVKPGPVTYAELMTETAKQATILGRINQSAQAVFRTPTVQAVLKSPAFKGTVKTLGAAGAVLPLPIAAAQLDDLDNRKVDGTISAADESAEEFGIMGTAGLGVGVGVALLVFTPVGWVAFAAVGAGAVACLLVDEDCFKTIYTQFIQTEESKKAYAELVRLRGERAAYLSGYSIHPYEVINVDEFGSYQAQWIRAGKPPISVPKEMKDRAFEAEDTRLWVENEPTADEILRFKLVMSAPSDVTP